MSKSIHICTIENPLFMYTHVTLIPCLVITDIEKEHSSFYKNFFSYKIFFYGINEKSKKNIYDKIF